MPQLSSWVLPNLSNLQLSPFTIHHSPFRPPFPLIHVSPIIICIGHIHLEARRLELQSLHLRDVLVPVDGGSAGFDALALACSLSKKNKGKVYAVYVIEVARTMALDAELVPEAATAEEVLEKAEDIADTLDYRIEGEILQARDAGHAIVDEAIERGVSAIIMGVGYEQPYGEFALGETSQYIIDHAPCQVIVVREPLGESV